MTDKKRVDLFNAVQRQYNLKKAAGEPVQQLSLIHI